MSAQSTENSDNILRKLIAHLLYCEHMGDVANWVEITLKDMGLTDIPDWDDLEDPRLRRYLKKKGFDV